MTHTSGLHSAARWTSGHVGAEPYPPQARTWHDRTSAAPASVMLVEAVLEALGLAAFICDQRARVQGLTSVAAHGLRSGGLQLIQGRLLATSPEAAVELERAIAQAASAPPLPARARVVINRAPNAPLDAQILDVLALAWPAGLAATTPLALVVLRSRSRERAELETIFQGLFGLTPAETDVAARLAAGEPREAIAAARGASLQTVRSQIKAIFSKLGVTRERQLAALLWR